MIQNSGSEEDAHALMDERKRKRMISNFESARRSRIRKKKYMNDLLSLMDNLKHENQQIFESIQSTTQNYLNIEAENSVLKAQISDLSFRISDIRMFEVFLSFRGEDTRASFVSHLYANLQNAGIVVFKDDESLRRGDHIDSLLEAIRQSQISVVVFSRNYAESQWCLKELEKIIECHRTIGQMVVPVFYDVDPSEVRHQTGEFGKSFQSLLNRVSIEEGEKELRERGKVQCWREALREAASISGIVVLNSRNESEAIKSVVENVIRLLDKTELFVVDNPVGVESRVLDTIQLLDLEKSNDVLLLGMWGMGGIVVHACFFIGMDRNDVIHILNGSGLCAENGIRVLVERSLVTVDHKNKLGMHDLLRDMGREIIRGKSPKEPEERSRLWFHEDVLDVLSQQSGTKAIEGLALNLPRTDGQCLNTKAFKNMKKLRLLQLAGVDLIGDYKYLSKNLRWLCWHEFPLTALPANFYQGSLVSLELENSYVKRVCKKAQVMENLKILNLSHSHYLTHTPDFSNLPNLEKLVLIDCPSLSEVSYTIGHLTKVLLINFQDCVSLCNLPRSIYKLKSLKTLILSGCLKIDKLEEDLEQMESLTTLVADKTAVTTIPFSIVRSKSIGYVSLCGYEGFLRDMVPSIIWSWMSPTNNSLSSLVQKFGGLSSLVSLDVPNSSSHHLASLSKDLPKLESLWVECGSELQLSQHTKIILDALYVTNLRESESPATTSQMPNINALALIECSSQVHVSGSNLLIQMGMSSEVSSNLKESILQNNQDCLLPHDCYPDWLAFNSKGSSVSFEIPQVNGYNLKTIMCHVHYSSPDSITSDGLKNLLVINHTKATIQLYKRNALALLEDEDWQRVVSNIEPGNKVEVVVVFGNRLTVNKTTIYLIYKPMGEKSGALSCTKQ
ncbi:unnamed protein product [Sphenostylis stenocarpa]|uniref:TIR domain-containing protein n=1 Tax=Sphenostylis stenocarpa TaxID=92480 RepID=A0AA86SH09_9FABA|nr:unnamed protein product [Sphenostylis stenocarpa]